MSVKHFDIHSSIVFQLGDQLISDEIQALIELVKNAYDADATIVKININTKAPPPHGSVFSDSKGFIEIIDNGLGMTEDRIDNGWLLISNSAKRDFKASKQTTYKGRTPLGDKGLGRLGVQRLGWKVEIITRPDERIIEDPRDKNREYHVAVDWEKYRLQSKLSTVAVDFAARETSEEPGTKLIISNLRNVDIWTGKNAFRRLQIELSKMISPFKRMRDFIISISLDGTPIDLANIAEAVRNTSPLRYTIEFSNGQFTATGRSKLSYLNPSQKDLNLYRQFVESDDGEAYLEFLKKSPKSKQINLRRSDDKNWFVEFSFSRNLSEYDGLALDENQKVADPGEFEGEIDFFYLNQGGANLDVFDRTSEYKQFVRDLSGIRIYRDGFAIRTDEDWLGLRSAATSGSSIFVLRPDNTIGYIAITSLGNSNLTELTNREGFVVNAYSDNFFEMLRSFIGFTEQAQSFIRRGFADFRKEIDKKDVPQENQDSTPEGLMRTFTKVAETALNHQVTLNQSAKEVRKILNKRGNSVGEGTIPSANIVLSKAEFSEIEKLLERAENSIKYLNDVQERMQLLKVVNDQIELLREQISQGYETMGLGLTAEALSHEISRIITNLLYQTDEVIKHITSTKMQDRKIHRYVDYVRSSATGLRRQLSHFTPSLRYVREKREDIDLNEFFSEIKSYYTDRFRDAPLEIRILNAQSGEFHININKGKLIQIMDNLIINSEYWLNEAIRVDRLQNGVITVELVKPYLYIYDNGRGIDQSVEATLFEPFVTTKKTGTGRGLGLFIVKQLLDAEDCTIHLFQERNSTNRLYKFEINLFSRIAK